MVDEVELIEETTETVPFEVNNDSLIDATQNVIINAAENVSEVLGATSKSAVAELPEIPIYKEVEFWVGMAFILAVAVLLKPAIKFVKKALQERVNKVISDIDEAVKLRDDAQQLLADYERRFVNAENEAQQIAETSRQNIKNLKERELAKLKSTLDSKETETERRIKAATEKARTEINLSASVAATELAQRAVKHYLQNTDKSRMIDEAIADLDKFIH